MSEISALTRRTRHQQWANEISERIRSGVSVEEWCAQHGIGTDTYKYRLHVVRKECLEASAPSSFTELPQPAVPSRLSPLSDSLSASVGGVSIELGDAVIRFDSSASEAMICAAVKAVRNA